MLTKETPEKVRWFSTLFCSPPPTCRPSAQVPLVSTVSASAAAAGSGRAQPSSSAASAARLSLRARDMSALSSFWIDEHLQCLPPLQQAESLGHLAQAHAVSQQRVGLDHAALEQLHRLPDQRGSVMKRPKQRQLVVMRAARVDLYRGAGRATSKEYHGPPFSHGSHGAPDRKSTRLNSSHGSISYAVFCLKKITRKRHHPGDHWRNRRLSPVRRSDRRPRPGRPDRPQRQGAASKRLQRARHAAVSSRCRRTPAPHSFPPRRSSD